MFISVRDDQWSNLLYLITVLYSPLIRVLITKSLTLFSFKTFRCTFFYVDQWHLIINNLLNIPLFCKLWSKPNRFLELKFKCIFIVPSCRNVSSFAFIGDQQHNFRFLLQKSIVVTPFLLQVFFRVLTVTIKESKLCTYVALNDARISKETKPL